MRYIDTHAHLNLAAFAEDAAAVAERCRAESVAVINIGTREETSKGAVTLAAAHAHCFAIVGLHPIQTVPGLRDEDESDEDGQPIIGGEVFNPLYYRSLIAEAKGKVVGIGECGLDYYRLSEGRGSTGVTNGGAHMTERMKGESFAYWHCPKESYATQEAAFLAQIALANELNLPLMIHTRGPKPGEESPTGRSVYEDVYEILKQHAKVPFTVHFYAGTYEEAVRFIDLGGSVSFTGVITFARVYESVVRDIPLSHLMAETDCPYVAPVPYRGQRCEPWMVAEVYHKIARIKNLPVEEVTAALAANVRERYGIDLAVF